MSIKFFNGLPYLVEGNNAVDTDGNRPMCTECVDYLATSFGPDSSMLCQRCRTISDGSFTGGDYIYPGDDEPELMLLSDWLRSPSLKIKVADGGFATIPLPDQPFAWRPHVFHNGADSWWVHVMPEVPEGVDTVTPYVTTAVDEWPADAIYVAGPMTGYPEHNYPAFAAMAATLRAVGCVVISPHELHDSLDHEWDWYLRRDLRELVKCTRIVMLPGWKGSRGAQLEHYVAQSLGLAITYPDQLHELFRPELIA